jgi:hypothetical protein
MFVNINIFDNAALVYEINPCYYNAGTLKGLVGYSYNDPDGILPGPSDLLAMKPTWTNWFMNCIQ